MKKWIPLAMMAIGLSLSAGAWLAQAEDLPREDEPVIQPPVEEKRAVEARLDTEHWEIGPFFGLYAPDGFGASPVFGIRLAYHVTEDVSFEGSYGMTRVDQTAFRRVTGLALVTNEDLSYWSVDAAYNLFPGQIFLTSRRTINSSIFLIGGLGQTTLDQRDHFTLNLGTGFKVFVTDWLDIRTDLRVHAFEADFTGAKERTFNIESTLALAFFF